MKFENLNIWKRALELSHQIHLLTRSFPSEERFILTSQIKRAADSVSLNIAEGSTGQSDKEFNRFLGISLRSCIEVVACLHLALKRELITEAEFKTTYNECEQIIKMIQSLRNKIKNDIG